jgi:hypothetical protein
MKGIPPSSALAQLHSDWRLWKRVEAEFQNRGFWTTAFMLATRGQPNEMVIGRFTAFELIEPEARAWLAYFRGIGAIAKDAL